MDRDQYDEVVQQAMMLSALARDIDTDAALRMLGRAETVGPIMDPTLYRAAMAKLAIIKRVLEAVANLQRRLPTIEECVQADAESQAWLELTGATP